VLVVYISCELNDWRPTTALLFLIRQPEKNSTAMMQQRSAAVTGRWPSWLGRSNYLLLYWKSYAK